MTPSIAEDGEHLSVRTAEYELRWRTGDRGVTRSPYLELRDAGGERWTRLSALSAVHTVDARDETVSVGAPVVTRDGDVVVVEVPAVSTVWRQRRLVLRCTAEAVELRTDVIGEGRVSELVQFGGSARLPTGASGTFRSSIDARSLFVPTPTEPVAFVRPAAASAQLGIVGDADPGRVHGIFSPPPLVLAFGRRHPEGPTIPTGGPWLALSIRDHVDRLRFTSLRYEALDGGFTLNATYGGHTVVGGAWSSPAVVLRHVPEALDAISFHRDDLIRHGYATEHRPDTVEWWREPIFCGWGAQVARGTAPAPELSRQEVYDELLGVLRDAELDPGTVVIDDRWQAAYGTADPDPAAWPDMRGWIAGRHAEGRRVLLWWKAWDPTGLPAEECILDGAGVPVAADPGSAAYRARLTRIVERLLGPQGLDADGFKVDFTQRAPEGQSFRSAPDSDGVWGIAALHRLVGDLHRAAKAIKPDALVITHTVHPSFAEVTDMVRTNDVLERDVDGRAVGVVAQLGVRASIVGRALPHHLVDTDQWPMPDRSEWLAYAAAQPELGVPALYYVERIDEGELITSEDLAFVGSTWAEYRRSLR